MSPITIDFLLASVMWFFQILHNEYRKCSNPRTGNATAEKIAEKNREN